MSSELDTPLSAFRRGLDRLASEVDSLAAEQLQARRLAGEEAVGAELMASRGLVAQLGVLWETAEQLGDLYTRQLRYWMDDHAATCSELMTGQNAAGADVATVARRHLERRLAHLGEGVADSARLVSRQTAGASQVLLDLWAPFFAVLGKDLASPRART